MSLVTLFGLICFLLGSLITLAVISYIGKED